MHPRDPLLHDVLNEGGNSDFELASLEAMLSTARRIRQRRRYATAGGTILAVVAFATTVFVTQRAPERPIDQASVSTIPAVIRVDTPPPPPTNVVRKLTDEELFAYFPGKQMALVGPPGDQRLLLLDPPDR